MNSIVFRIALPGHHAMALCTHDPAGAGFTTLAILETADAAALSGDHTGIYCLFDDAVPVPGVEKKPLLIERVPDRKPGARAWQMRIGDDVATRVDRRDGLRKTIRLDDEAVHLLATYTKATFAPGQPDWVLREVEILEDQAAQLEEQAAAARAKASEARASWQAMISAVPQPEAALEVEP